MKKTIGLIFASLLLAIVGMCEISVAQTKPRPWSINRREQRQQKRIRRGIRSGELTARETYRLDRRQYQIRRLESRYRRSGNSLTWRERYRLQRKLNRASNNIRRQKHDRQDYPRR